MTDTERKNSSQDPDFEEEELDLEEEELDDYEIEERIEALFATCGNDFGKIEEFVKAYEDHYIGEEGLWEFAFRTAVRVGNADYVNIYYENIDLNDGDGCSTYLDDAKDTEMEELLMDLGAFRSFDSYSDCRFAYETANGSILTFAPSFQVEVFRKYKETYGLTDETIIAFLRGEEIDEPEDTYLECDLESLGVYLDGDTLDMRDLEGDDGMETAELIENLGYDVKFEGDSWKFEILGVYFVK